MKSLLLFISIAMSVSAAAAESPCDKFMVCGTFVGAGYSVRETGKSDDSYNEQIVITGLDETSVKYDDYLYGDNQKPGDKDTYQTHIRITFKEDGSFTGTVFDKKSPLLTGQCTNLVCGVNFLPWKNPDSFSSNVNILRFEKDVLERNMMASAKMGEFLMEHTRLTKKEK